MEEEKKHKLGLLAILILSISSVVADVITLVPVAGDVVGWLYWGLVLIYFWKAGYGFINWGRIATTTISTIAELVPGVQEFPTIALGMAIIIVLIKTEEKTGISVTSLASKGKGSLNIAGSRSLQPKLPLNQDGLRPPSGGLVK